jgi:hypothetical protein
LVSRPFQANNHITAEEKQRIAVVRENNTIATEMIVGSELQQEGNNYKMGNESQTIFGKIPCTQMATKPTNTFVSCYPTVAYRRECR